LFVESGHLFLEYLSDSFAERQNQKSGSCPDWAALPFGWRVVSCASEEAIAAQ
jgi:hypothetical protein